MGMFWGVWGLWKETGPEWHIVGDKRRLALSVPDCSQLSKGDLSPDCCSVQPPVCLPACLYFCLCVFKSAGQTQCVVGLYQSTLWLWMEAVHQCLGSFEKYKSQSVLKNPVQRLLWAFLEWKKTNEMRDVETKVYFWSEILICGCLSLVLRRRNSRARQGPEDTYFSSSGRQKKKWSPSLTLFITLSHSFSPHYSLILPLTHEYPFISQSNWSPWRPTWTLTLMRTPTRPSSSSPVRSTRAT